MEDTYPHLVGSVPVAWKREDNQRVLHGKNWKVDATHSPCLQKGSRRILDASRMKVDQAAGVLAGVLEEDQKADTVLHPDMIPGARHILIFRDQNRCNSAARSIHWIDEADEEGTPIPFEVADDCWESIGGVLLQAKPYALVVISCNEVEAVFGIRVVGKHHRLLVADLRKDEVEGDSFHSDLDPRMADAPLRALGRLYRG